jgi:hypothetical protein
MARPTRMKRPKAARTEPERSFTRRSPREAPPPGRPPEAAEELQEPRDARSAAYEAVNGAYRVIDEYMRQGQRFAEEFWLPSPGGRPAGAELPRMVERFMQTAGEMGSAWLEMIASVATPPRTEEIRGTAGPFGAGGHAPEVQHDLRSGLTVAVESRRPVRLSIEAPSGFRDAQVSALVSTDPVKPPITGVRIEMIEDETVLRLIVPEEQPAGRYHGVLLDRRTERPLGTASLVLG